MGRCTCILASGPHKGTQCIHQSKAGSPFCGHHKNCQNRFATHLRPKGLKTPASSPGKQPQIPEFPIVPEGSLTLDTCPDELRPIDGMCPPKFPNQQRLSDNSICCQKSLKKIRQLDQRHQLSFSTQINPSRSFQKMPPFKCTLDAYNIRYMPGKELLPRRNIDISEIDDDCQSMNQALMKELPSLVWIQDQKQYLARLNQADQQLVRFYTDYGDRILNNFIRHGWSITEDDLDDIRIYYNEGEVAPVLESVMTTLNDQVTVERVLMEIYNRLNQIINQSPINPQRFVSYRGSRTKDYFDQVQGIFQNVGFFSTTLLIEKAIYFSQRKYMTRIMIPEGYHCLYLESLTNAGGEHEILMSDQTKYYITSGFRWRDYGTYIPTNELVLIKTRTKPLSLTSLNTHHNFQDLITNLGVRRLMTSMTDKILEYYGGDDFVAKENVWKIWLRRLADHKIYTIDDFEARGIQLKPTYAEVEPDMTFWNFPTEN